jgi:hypothetical protein
MKKLLLVLASLLCVTHTRADTVTVGYFDPAAGLSGIQVLGQASGSFPVVQLIGLPLLPTGPTGFGFDHILAAVIPPGGNSISGGLGGPNPTFEFTFNDGFSPPQGGTSYLYATWEGTFTGSPLVILPTLWGSIETPPVNPGYSLTTQVLVCNTPNPFCGPFVGGGVLGQGQFSGPPSLDSITLTGLLPGQNFKISEVFAFNNGPSPAYAQGDVGGVIETTLQSPNIVPAPIVGAGIPGLLATLAGLLWLGRRRSIGSRS